MTKYIGRLIDLGIARESSRGVGVAPAYWIPRVSLSFDDKVVTARETAGAGELADSDNAFVTTKYAQGEIEAEIRDSSFGLFLYSLLGSISSGSVVDQSYTHSFTLSESNQHQSLSITVQDPNTSEIYELSMLDFLEINVELDQIVRFTAGFMSKQGTSSVVRTVAYTAENKFTKKHLRLKIADVLASLTAASAISVKRLRLRIEKNVIMDDVLGTVEPEDFLNRQFSVEGEIELNYEDETYKNYMRAGTKRAMEIAFINTDAVIGAGTTNPALTFRLPLVDFLDWEPDYANDEIVKQTVSFKGNNDVSGGNKIISTCTLVNGVVSY